MRDIAVLIFLLAVTAAAFRRPWLGVLGLAVFSYMNPHAYAWGFMRTFPAYQFLFIVVAVAFLAEKDKQPPPRDGRVYAFFILWLYFSLTTFFALVPDAAFVKLIEVSKIYLPLIFTLLLITDRKKLFFLIITIAASLGIIATKGGLFALATGFSYRVWGPPTTQFYGNNEFAIATIMIIPLLVLWYRESEQKWIRLGLMAAIPFCVASAVSSWSRGALLTLFATGTLLIWHSRKKFLLVPLLFAAVYLLATQLPEDWFARMYTIETYEIDASARSRLEVWRDGLSYALGHPFLGSGFDGWRWVSKRDWHSAYVEIIAEHGFVAFGLWIFLILGTLFSLTRLPRRTQGVPGMEWVANYAYMLRASIVAYMVGSLFLGISYWDLIYHLVFISILVKKFALEELAQHAGNTVPAIQERSTPARGISPARP